MSEVTQQQLLGYVDAAFTFYGHVKGEGYLPSPKQVQALLKIAGVSETLEHIKICGDILRELEDVSEAPDAQP